MEQIKSSNIWITWWLSGTLGLCTMFYNPDDKKNSVFDFWNVDFVRFQQKYNNNNLMKQKQTRPMILNSRWLSYIFNCHVRAVIQIMGENYFVCLWELNNRVRSLVVCVLVKWHINYKWYIFGKYLCYLYEVSLVWLQSAQNKFSG